MLSGFDELLKRYARLVAETGVTTEKEHTVVLQISVEQAPLAQLITQEAYKLGAAGVTVQWTDDQIQREFLLHAVADRIENISQSKIDQADGWLEKGASRISVVSADPDAFAGIDSRQVASYQSANSKALMDLRKATRANRISWTVIAAAGKQWVAEVFPELPEEKQIETLWNQVFKTTRVYEEDPVLAWKKHDEKLTKKAEELNRGQFSTLHYTAPGIDIIIGLPEDHLWGGAGSYNARGEKFMANIPTEEVFTTPDSHRMDGYISGTKPLSYTGTVISDMEFTFKNGKVVDFSAEQGEDVLAKLFDTDEGARRLGEVTLVPDLSPISQSDIIFFNTLSDKNASNHLALDSAYAFSVKGGAEISDEELAEAGLNRGQTHVDFMVGSGKMGIDGIREDSSTVPIFRDGD